MSNNLRIIYDNLALSSTITASSTAGSTAAANLKVNQKGLVWRSGATTNAILLVSLGSSKLAQGIILPFTNLTSIATIQVIGYSSAPTLGGTLGTPTISGGTVEFDTGAVLACPWDATVPWGSGSIPSGSNTYAYGGGQCARVWIPIGMQEVVTHLTIQIIDTSLSYIEASHLVVGEYWSPRFNTSYGITLSPVDNSEHQRAMSGDLYTNRGTIVSKLTFELKYMTSEDKYKLLSLFKGNGISRPLFVSVFPDDDDPEKERDFQIYGKLSTLDSIVHPTFMTYSSQINLEEI